MNCPLCEFPSHASIGIKNNCNIVKCKSCGFIHMNPMPSHAQFEEIYDKYHQTENYLKKLRKKLFTSKFKLMRLKKYYQPGAKQFLDVGCSIGATVEAAHRLGFNATGIDLDKAVIQQAQKLFPNNEFIRTSSSDLVSKGKVYDLIYCAEVVEHVAQPNEFIGSLSSLMKPNAILYLTTPDAGHRKVPTDFVTWKQVTPPEHIAFYTQKTMKKLLQNHGLEVVKFLWSLRANMRVICKKSG